MTGTRLFDFDHLHVDVPVAPGWSVVPISDPNAARPGPYGPVADPYVALADQAIAAGQVDPDGRGWAIRFFRAMGGLARKGLGPAFRRGCVTGRQYQFIGGHLEVYFEPPMEDYDVDGDPSRLEFLARKFASDPSAVVAVVEHPLGPALRVEQRTAKEGGPLEARIGCYVPLARVGDGRSVVLNAAGSTFGGAPDSLVAGINWMVGAITLTTQR